jgi:hypothetical protein
LHGRWRGEEQPLLSQLGPLLGTPADELISAS